MKTRKIITLIMLSLVAVILLSSKVQANYQSVQRGKLKEQIGISKWIPEIRQMESSGNGMGLKETIDTTTGLATTETNNIDVHMLKNTEYGAIVLLGASDYGKQGATINDRRMDQGAVIGANIQASTTGNRYGVYEIGYVLLETGSAMYTTTRFENVAGLNTSYLPQIAARYINRYNYEVKSAKNGDATTETQLWHGSKYASWLSSYFFARGGNGAFSYVSNSDTSDIQYARAAAVVGTGF